MHIPQFIYSSIGGYLVVSILLTNVNNAAMNMGVQTSAQVPAFNSFRYIPRNEIAGTYGNSMFNIFQALLYYFLKLLPHVAFLPAMYKGFNFSTALSTLAIFWVCACVCVCVCVCVRVFNNNHPNGI